VVEKTSDVFCVAKKQQKTTSWTVTEKFKRIARESESVYHWMLIYSLLNFRNGQFDDGVLIEGKEQWRPLQ